MGTFTQVNFLWKKTVLLLRYRGRRSSRYFILMQYKLKCFNQMRRLLFSVQWAMPIRKWFILLSQFCWKAWSNQWIGLQISLNDLFSSLPHAPEVVLTQSCNRTFKSIKSVEWSAARHVPRGMPLHRHTLYFHNIFACRNLGYICLHFAEQTEEDPSIAMFPSKDSGLTSFRQN